jgi:16S rRNA (guanine966-N2)-methyltransferase
MIACSVATTIAGDSPAYFCGHSDMLQNVPNRCLCSVPRDPNPTSNARNRVRIIGGRWRGRSVEFEPLPGLRPTPNRVRETLFNWLQGYIEGSRCLDLFGGSGALSLEALSRGAASVTVIEQSAAALTGIRRNLERFGGGAAELLQVDAQAWLATAAARRYQIVFIDPPFGSDLAHNIFALLASSEWLAPRAWVYLESSAALPLPALPRGWELMREKRAGDVGYRLFRTP